MKTVSELAKELNVSNKTIYRHLDKVRQNAEQDVTVTNAGIMYITDFGEEKVTESVTEVRQFREKSDSDKDSQTVPDTSKSDDEVQFFRNMVTELNAELKTEREHSRQQADRIADLAEQIADLTKNQQVLFGREQQKSLPIVSSSNDDISDGEPVENSEDNKKGFFKKIFGKK